VCDRRYDAVAAVGFGLYSLLYINNTSYYLSNKDIWYFPATMQLLGLTLLRIFTDYTAILRHFQCHVIRILQYQLWHLLVCMLLSSILYLDAGLSSKHDVAKTEDLTWLNQFGTIGTFLKNDIKLIKRNKRSKLRLDLVLCFFLWFLFFTN
jgi:hypothetical protein